MRIAIVTNEFPSISETFISNQVKYLAQNGHEVFVFCFIKNPMLFHQLFNSHSRVKIVLFSRRKLLQYLLLHPFQIANAFSNHFNMKLFFSRKARASTINAYSPDIVHFEFSGIGIGFLEEIQNLHAKTVVSCRGSAEKVKLLADDERKSNLKKLFSQVTAIHCVSEDMRQTILPYCSKPEKIFINFPSIDTTLFKRSVAYQPQPVITIISIGRISFQKGYLIGLLAVKRLKDAGISFKWIIVGKGSKYQELFFHIHEMGLQHQVVLAGAQSGNAVIELYQQADIYFLPSYYEGIANAALEAMSMELPVVSTRSGGMEEVITHGVNGLLANVYDDQNLARLLLQLANDFELRKALGTAARKRIVEQFDVQLQIAKYESVYTQLVNDQEQL